MASIVQLVDGVVANRFELTDNGLNFGRIATNSIIIDDKAVSSEHAAISLLKGEGGDIQYVLNDLGSTNGTYVNEQKTDKQLLHHKDVIRVGWNSFTFINEDEVDLEKTTKVKKSWIPGVYFSDD